MDSHAEHFLDQFQVEVGIPFSPIQCTSSSTKPDGAGLDSETRRVQGRSAKRPEDGLKAAAKLRRTDQTDDFALKFAIPCPGAASLALRWALL